jgi:hypothetical protein
MTESPRADSAEHPLGPTARRDRSVAARRAARLNRGVLVAEIAAREGLSLKRVRNLVRGILATRTPQPPAEFVALQISRLNEALLVSDTAMHGASSGANFEAVDRVVRIVRELDRYHGFVPYGGPTRAAENLRLAARSQTPLALEAPIAERLGNGAASD